MNKVPFTEKKFVLIFGFVTSLFLLWGVAHSISDVLNKHFQNVLDLSKAESGLIQFSVCYFIIFLFGGRMYKVKA